MSAIKRFHLFLLHGEANKQHFYKPFIQFLLKFNQKLLMVWYLVYMHGQSFR